MANGRIRQIHDAATITAATLERFRHVVRLWDTPTSQLEGAQVVCEITIPTVLEIIAEQHEPFSDQPERAKIRSQGREGWVLALMRTKIPCGLTWPDVAAYRCISDHCQY